MHCCVRKGGEEESKAKQCITDRVDLGGECHGHMVRLWRDGLDCLQVLLSWKHLPF